jgi:hypothetical protein
MLEGEFVQLPVSRDLWRGNVRSPKATDNVDPVTAPRPFAKIDEAMASILAASKGANILTCTWCGLQSADKAMREHLKKDHASVVEPPTDEQIAAATLAASTPASK